MDQFTHIFSTALSQQSVTVLGLAFIAGMISSFLPCTIAMMPILIGYIGGYGNTNKVSLLIQIACFILGLSVTFSAFGIMASLMGTTFGAWLGHWWYILMGGICVLMGLQLLEFIQIPLPQFVTSAPDVDQIRGSYGNYLAPLVLGIIFGTVASPCGTPFLIAISSYISQEQNILLGGGALFLYAVGQGVLLLIAGLATGLLKKKAILNKVGWVLSKLSGWVFIVMGLILIAKDWSWLTKIIPEGLF